MLVTHHQLLSAYDLGDLGTVLPYKPKPLLDGKRISAWLWGHEHRCMGFVDGARRIPLVRCIGHGGVPIPLTPGDGTIPPPGAWLETETYEANGERWHKFGFAVIDFAAGWTGSCSCSRSRSRTASPPPPSSSAYNWRKSSERTRSGVLWVVLGIGLSPVLFLLHVPADGVSQARQVARRRPHQGLPVPDLSVEFCGVKAPNPFWLASPRRPIPSIRSASPSTPGWGGAVWKTLGRGRSSTSPRATAPSITTVGR